MFYDQQNCNVTHILNAGAPIIYLEPVKLGTSNLNFHVLTDTQDYHCIYARLPLRGMC